MICCRIIINLTHWTYTTERVLGFAWCPILPHCYGVWTKLHFASPQLKTTFSTDSRVQNMFDILLDEEMEKEKREKVGVFPYFEAQYFIEVFNTILCPDVAAEVRIYFCLRCLGCKQPDCPVKRGCRSWENLPEQRRSSAAQYDRDGQTGDDVGCYSYLIRNVHRTQSSSESDCRSRRDTKWDTFKN